MPAIIHFLAINCFRGEQTAKTSVLPGHGLTSSPTESSSTANGSLVTTSLIRTGRQKSSIPTSLIKDALQSGDKSLEKVQAVIKKTHFPPFSKSVKSSLMVECDSTLVSTKNLR